MEKQIVFLSFEKRVSQDGEHYNAVTLGEIKRYQDDVVRVQQKTFFVSRDDDYSKISFGAVVEVEFGEPKTFGGYPPLTDILVVEDSPYLD